MAKINQEEYEILKELYDKWKWIVRDEDDELYIFIERPNKNKTSNQWINYEYDWKRLYRGISGSVARLFNFIRWEDEEPYEISELIEEYEENYKGSWEHAIEFSEEVFGESEETEVKKDIEWLKNQVDELETTIKNLFDGATTHGTRISLSGSLATLKDFRGYINQLDEPEVLSQELVSIPQFVAEWYESEGKLSSWWNWFYKWGRDEGRTELETKTIRWMQDFNEEAFVNMFLHGYTVEEEQKYYVINTKHRMMLVRMMDGKTITEADPFPLGELYEGERESHRLTEQEIKDYDERYWPFAVKVEEIEE